MSPYHGGSHGAWAEGYMKYSQHQITLWTLPNRFWKWRMHGGAITLARRLIEEFQAEPKPQIDLFLATDMLDLTTFLALLRDYIQATPAVIFMHENQLTYPLPSDPTKGPMRRQHGERDLHYAFINYASMLAANGIFFNSEYHYQTLFEELPRYLKRFPEYNELETISSLNRKSGILPVGVDFEQLGIPDLACKPDGIPLIIWNQRWEYDKNPGQFFSALYAIAEEGIPFRLAVCGANFRRQPIEFDIALERLSKHIVHFGYANPEDYRRLLWQATVTVSTAWHEFFGISVVEAMACRTFPILPRRLSYLEIIPPRFHERCLYDNEEELIALLRRALSHAGEAEGVAVALASAARRFDWQKVAPLYDDAMARFM